MTNPQTGGSYLRNPDGSLTRVSTEEVTGGEHDLATAEQSDEAPAEDETSAKKGKA
ncbi:hypothetical protein [Rhizobium paknamense]|uniref:Uncharacterized protein n=1 Tax=Rhizobium paknamense TaxID=1206817 RepID=A0ABU0IBP4_9HYPH|nr:hypothetical protein [Rhizobium paknamense]MDQ0454716.1 hypothetical protein [Rhizobium paknamense]